MQYAYLHGKIKIFHVDSTTLINIWKKQQNIIII